MANVGLVRALAGAGLCPNKAAFMGALGHFVPLSPATVGVVTELCRENSESLKETQIPGVFRRCWSSQHASSGNICVHSLVKLRNVKLPVSSYNPFGFCFLFLCIPSSGKTKHEKPFLLAFARIHSIRRGTKAIM